MTSVTRRLLLLVTTLALAGCSTSSSSNDAGTTPLEDAGPSDAGTGGPDGGALDAGGDSDAGPVPETWDGGAETLTERTDFVDPGPYSTCTSLLPPGAPVTACDDASLVDRSSCPAGALDTLDPVGLYQAMVRPSAGTYVIGYNLALPLDGGAGGLNYRPLTRQDVGPGTFVVASTTPATQALPAREHLFVGCTRPEPDRVNGCYVQCSQGKVRTVGTFTAMRPRRARGEGEASGLTLVSESAVPLTFPVDVYVAKDHAYVVAVGHKPELGGLAVFDVKDRAHPVLKKTLQLPGDTYWNGVWAKGDALYIASATSGVIVYDITDPADPQYVRAVPGDANNVHTVFVDGDRLYAMSPSPTSSTLLFDIRTPLAPVLLNRVEPSVSIYFDGPHDAFAYQERLYVHNGSDDYVVFDVADPEHVQELGMYAFEGQFSHAGAVGTFAGRTIAFEGGENTNAHLRVLDVTDPANIRLIGEYGLRFELSIHNMILQGTKLYIAYYQEGVRVLDVSVPPKPREVAYFNNYRETDPGRTGDFFEGAIGIRVPGDGYIYVVDTVRGLLILREP